MSDPKFEQVFGLQSRDKVAIEQLRGYFDWVKTFEEAVAWASTESGMGEPVTVQVLLVLLIGFDYDSVVFIF